MTLLETEARSGTVGEREQLLFQLMGIMPKPPLGVELQRARKALRVGMIDVIAMRHGDLFPIRQCKGSAHGAFSNSLHPEPNARR